MTLILNGTDNSATTPAVTGTDTDTGIYYPTSNQVAIATAGTQAMLVDASQNVTISSDQISSATSHVASQHAMVLRSATTNQRSIVAVAPNGSGGAADFCISTTSDLQTNYNQIRIGSDGTGFFVNSEKGGTETTKSLRFGVAGTALTIDTSNNVGIGTSSPNAKLEIKAASASQRQLQLTHFNSTDGWYFTADDTGGVLNISRQGSSSLNGEAMRIDSSGNVLVGTTSSFNSNAAVLTALGTQQNQMVYFRNSNATNPAGIIVNYSGATPNNTASEFFFGNDPSQTRFALRSNGGLANYSANNSNLSDRREKTNFAPAKSYLDVICAIPVQTFNYIDQNMEEDDGLTLGVVAQDVQAVAPELVMESDWSSERDGSKMRLSIYQTDLQYALMKCIQEQQALITSLTARIAALELT